MNSEGMNEVRDELRRKMETSLTSEVAEHFADQTLKKFVEEEKAIELTEDEERMLKAYRAFQTRNKPGAIFQWKSDESVRIVTPVETSFVLDPKEVVG